MFCPHCGNAVDQIPGVPVTEEREPVEVILARIEADRAIQVARIEANARRAEMASAEIIAETEADAQVEAAEAVAEILTADDEPEPAPEPLEIIAPEMTDVEEDVEDAPPPAEGSPVPDAAKKTRGLGMW
jgi:hypothetical protein